MQAVITLSAQENCYEILRFTTIAYSSFSIYKRSARKIAKGKFAVQLSFPLPPYNEGLDGVLKITK